MMYVLLYSSVDVEISNNLRTPLICHLSRQIQDVSIDVFFKKKLYDKFDIHSICTLSRVIMLDKNKRSVDLDKINHI